MTHHNLSTKRNKVYEVLLNGGLEMDLATGQNEVVYL